MKELQHIAQSSQRDKEKQREYNARYYLENKEKFKEYRRKHVAENSEKVKAREARWRADHPERMKAFRLKWQEANKDDPEYKARRSMQQRMRDATPAGRIKQRVNAKKYREKYPEKARGHKMDWHYRSKYGITVADRDRLFEKQGKRCQICRSDSSTGRGFHVDHCHITQRLRGIVCHHCNLMLGHSRDNVAILEAAIVYLKGSK